jgi:hypothetical protein
MASKMVTIASEDSGMPNVLSIYEHDGRVYVEMEGKHDGTKVCTTVVCSRAKFATLLRLSGLVASVMLWA